MPYLWKDLESAIKKYQKVLEAVKKTAKEIEEEETE